MLVEVMTCTTRQEEYYVFIDGRKATVTLGWTSDREPCGYQNNVDARRDFGDEEEEKEEREEGQARGWRKKATVEAGTRVGPSTWPASFVKVLIGWIHSSTAGPA